MTTYKELLDLVLDYMGADVSQEGYRYARQAVQHAMRQVSLQRRWAYYMHRLRVTTVAAVSTGTVAYDHTGGTYERMLTIAGSTWPTWATFGTVVISNIPYEVAEYKSTTQITLTELSNPGADVASGTSYTLYRDTYPLPADFINLDSPLEINGTDILEYVHPNEWLVGQQSCLTQGTPRIYTIKGDPNYIGTMAIALHPTPDAAHVLDSTYNRRARQLSLDEYNAGTVTATSSSTTVTGSGTAWTSGMVGAVIRFSSDSLNTPTGLAGASPFHLERTVMEVGSATSLTVDAVPGENLTGVKYSISDPVDVEDTMLDLVRAEAFKQARLSRRIVATQEELVEYERAKDRAHEADSKSAAARAEYGGRWHRPWLRDAVTSSTII